MSLLSRIRDGQYSCITDIQKMISDNAITENVRKVYVNDVRSIIKTKRAETIMSVAERNISNPRIHISACSKTATGVDLTIEVDGITKLSAVVHVEKG